MAVNSHEPSQWTPLEKLLSETLREQRSKRRWTIFFRLLFPCLILLGILFPQSLRFFNAPSEQTTLEPHVAFIDIQGAIYKTGANSAQNVTKALKKALHHPHTIGVILRINSPGGSPVQATQIYSEIQHYRLTYPQKPILSVCEDICASAAYYIASATQSIYSSPASLIGSIGVLLDSFGFAEGLQKLGIERRLLTAGQRKAMLDPYSPLKTEDVHSINTLLQELHQQFINAVKQGRGDRLKTLDQPESTLFSGLVWTGKQAQALGLIDGFGYLRSVASEVFKTELVVDYTAYPSLFEKLSETWQVSSQFLQQFRPAIPGSLSIG